MCLIFFYKVQKLHQTTQGSLIETYKFDAYRIVFLNFFYPHNLRTTIKDGLKVRIVSRIGLTDYLLL